MKVLDLQCTHGHVFEGWFSSEEDFLSQCAGALLTCPLCGDASITKRLSAPRLNLGSISAAPAPTQEVASIPSQAVPEALQAAWMALARRIVAQTDDVGTQFPEVARKMHYGELEERAIRGQATPEQTQSLLEEGIAVLPLALPAAVKDTLH